MQIDLDPAATGTVELKLDQVYKARPFKETDTVKLVDIESKLLTKFHGKPTRMRAGVVLPPSFAKEPDRKYPVVYEIPGFGGEPLRRAFGAAGRKAWDVAGAEMICVVLDPNCRLGHHVFADSANNGPVGHGARRGADPAHREDVPRDRHRAVPHRPLVRRLEQPVAAGHLPRHLRRVLVHRPGPGRLPRLPADQRLRRRARTCSPTPTASARPLARDRRRSRRSSTSRSRTWRSSWAAAGNSARSRPCSARGDRTASRASSGTARPGAIDSEIAAAWEKYDIRLVLERNWKTLGPKLAGKLHVYMGDVDTFYLEGATRLLKESLAKLKSDAVVELFPKKNHGNLVDAAPPQADERGDGRRGTQAREGRAAVAAPRPRP